MELMIMNTIKAVKGETFDILARKLFGHEKYAAQLLMANPDKCHLMIFEGGETVKVPQVEVTEESPLPPWKQSA